MQIQLKKRQQQKTFIVEKTAMTDHSENCPNIPSHFKIFSTFGDSGSSGRQITLSQSDRWLRQAKVIDGWNLTTIDTVIAFRKISKGSIWLEYESCRVFLDYLSKQKHLNISEVIEKLEVCGRPSFNSLKISFCKSTQYNLFEIENKIKQVFS